MKFQSTPPRGRRHLSPYELDKKRVSIHASTWEATVTVSLWHVVLIVSIHASTWEATSAVSLRALTPPFQSTPPRGRRPSSSASVIVDTLFQSTPPRGRRHQPRLQGDRTRGFNPRLHVGGDVPLETGTAPSACFNPRLHVGGDQLRNSHQGTCHVSIHASTWEATVQSRQPTSHGSFNPRLHVGGDEYGIVPQRLNLWFQSTPPRGRRRSVRQL